MEGISEQQQTAYNGALLIENRADMLSASNPDSSRETYYEARRMYQLLGDKVKTGEVDNKIQEINVRQLADLQTANNLIQEGLSLLNSGNPALAIANFNKAKLIYNKLGDSGNSRSTDEYIKQAHTFVKIEDNTKQLEQQSKEELAVKQQEIDKKNAAIAEEMRKAEERNQKIILAGDLKNKGDELAFAERYIESIDKYEEAKKLYTELDLKGETEYLEYKIKRNEGYLYELQGDQAYKAKKWIDAEQKYKMSADSFDKAGDISEEVKSRVEKKLAKATRKVNKRWWQFWK